MCQAIDLIVLSGAFLYIVAMRFLQAHDGSFHDFLALRSSPRNLLVGVLCISTWRMILMTVGVYSPSRQRSLPDYLFRCVIALNSCTAVVGLIEVVLRKEQSVWRSVEIFWLLAVVLMASARLLLVLFDRLLKPSIRRRRKLIIVGSGARARQVLDELGAHREWSYSLVGFVDSEPQGALVPATLLLGAIADLEQILAQNAVDEVLVALPMKSQYEVVGHSIAVCQKLGVRCQYYTDYFGTAKAKNVTVTGRRTQPEAVSNGYRLRLKRVMDFGGALTIVVALAPVYVVTAAAVKLSSPGPILFSQRRYGLNKRPFSMYKFRSMHIGAESRQATLEQMKDIAGPGFVASTDPRLTPIGRFLRRYAIDELPQMFNVLTGEMSLVGPRPLLLREVQQCSQAWSARRFSVKPGVTCLGQIWRRKKAQPEASIELDLQYIDNWSLSLDLVILLKTIPAVLASREAS